MASIHIKEIQKILFEKGSVDALPNKNNNEGYFLEIKFDNPISKSSKAIDEEYKDKVITLDCPYGSVIILCDADGQLKSIELS